MLIIGIDEAGRGPLAGPVTVAVFAAKEKIGAKILKNIFENKLRDSKKLSPKKREEIYKEFLKMKKTGEVDFRVAHSSPALIDKRGVSKCIQNCIDQTLLKFPNLYDRKNLGIRLDGLLKAPAEFKDQKTIIKGDEKNIWIACASIVAKVSRDRLMCRLAKKYPKYLFEIHKGYGTKLHRSLIKRLGLSNLHRTSFCANIQTWSSE